MYCTPFWFNKRRIDLFRISVSRARCRLKAPVRQMKRWIRRQLQRVPSSRQTRCTCSTPSLKKCFRFRTATCFKSRLSRCRERPDADVERQLQACTCDGRSNHLDAVSSHEGRNQMCCIKGSEVEVAAHTEFADDATDETRNYWQTACCIIRIVTVVLCIDTNKDESRSLLFVETATSYILSNPPSQPLPRSR